MREFTAVIERCSETGFLIGYVPGLSGAHSQGEDLDEVGANLVEVIGMLFEGGPPEFNLRLQENWSNDQQTQ
jgi:predicted RNase H-like HicB family nuclease